MSMSAGRLPESLEKRFQKMLQIFLSDTLNIIFGARLRFRFREYSVLRTIMSAKRLQPCGENLQRRRKGYVTR